MLLVFMVNLWRQLIEKKIWLGLYTRASLIFPLMFVNVELGQKVVSCYHSPMNKIDR